MLNCMMRFFFLLILIPFGLFSQTNIETKLVMADTVNYQFTSEWQYLTTDIYLFNPNKFDKLINELNFQQIGRRQRSKMHTDEFIEFLFVSADLKNVSYISNSDLVYPLYNFRVNRDDDQQYHTFVSNNIDHIRIIDNLPLYNAGNNIDAQIKVQAITNNNSDMIMNMIGKQLQNISSITSPAETVLKLVGEFGSFIESNTKKREYQFSSTIRLYEQQNFDTRLHSVKVFVMNTQKSDSVDFDATALSAYLDSTNNPVMDRKILESKLNFGDYPVIVVLNYRSMYQMEQISGDEVNQEAIDQRRARILIDYKNGLISDETYRQERDFLRFLTAFVELKNSIELYNLNKSSGNPGASKISIPKVIARYNYLLSLNDEMKMKYTANPIYTSIFMGEYDEIVSFADLYLDNDPVLRGAKDLVLTLKQLEGDKINKLDSIKMEQALKLLNSSLNLGEEFVDKTAEGQKSKEYKDQIETRFYDQFYREQIASLAALNGSETESSKLSYNLQRMAALTNCSLCKTAALNTVDAYSKRQKEVALKKAIAEKDSLFGVASDSLFRFVSYSDCIKENLDQIENSGQKPLSFDMLRYHQQLLQKHINELDAKLKVYFDQPDLDIISKFNEAFKREVQLANRELMFFRRNNACLLKCNCISSEAQPVLKAISNVSSDSLRLAVTQQLDLFRQLDLTMYASLDKTNIDSVRQVKQQMIEENRQLIETLYSKLKTVPESMPQPDFLIIQNKLSALIDQIANNINNFCIKFPDDCIN